MRIFRHLFIAFSLLVNLAFSADAQVTAAQLGGVIQGAPLKLVGSVSTLVSGGNGDLAFNLPQGLTTDGVNLYVADTGNNIIRKIVIATGVVSVLAGSREASHDNGSAFNAGFRRPQGITTDGISLYIADTYNNAIRKITLATGMVSTFAGIPGKAGSYDSKGSEATFFNPRGITNDGKSLYVTDSRNHLIRQIDIATGKVSTFAGVDGRVGHEDGIGKMASFNEPIGITTDGTNLYVADTSNNIIRKIVIATKEVTTLAGKVGAFGQNDGPGAGASFTGPFGLTTDGMSLYVADTFDNAIRKVDIATGLVSSIAGKAPASGRVDGVGALAAFTRPAGVVTNGNQLYVLDTNNNAIRVVK
jgi:sugar lactone lactonase YvrE